MWANRKQGRIVILAAGEEVQGLLVLFGIRKNCHNSRRNVLFCVFMERLIIKLTVVTVEECHCYQLHTKFYSVFLFYG